LIFETEISLHRSFGQGEGGGYVDVSRSRPLSLERLSNLLPRLYRILNQYTTHTTQWFIRSGPRDVKRFQPLL